MKWALSAAPLLPTPSAIIEGDGYRCTTQLVTKRGMTLRDALRDDEHGCRELDGELIDVELLVVEHGEPPGRCIGAWRRKLLDHDHDHDHDHEEEVCDVRERCSVLD
jgi:hypothetical protein